MIERQELHCHNCDQYVQFNMDVSLNGNHVLTCPICGHEHCRVVNNGIITDDRWDQRNGPAIIISAYTTTSTSVSTFSTYTSASDTNSTTSFIYDSWLQTTAS